MDVSGVLTATAASVQWTHDGSGLSAAAPPPLRYYRLLRLPPEEPDTLAWAAAPDSVRWGQDINVSLAYRAAPPVGGKYVFVGVTPAGTRNWIGVTSAAVTPGTGSVDLAFQLDVRPDENTTYVLDALLADDQPGGWVTTAEAGDRRVAVVIDRVEILQAPGYVENGQSYTVRLGWKLESNGWAKVDLLRPGAPAGSDWFGGAQVQVPPGSGTSDLAVVITGFPEPDNDYRWSASVGPTPDWQDATAADELDPVTAVSDSLTITSAPAAVRMNQDITVWLDHTVQPGSGKSLSVSILESNTWDWLGGTNVPIAAGSGSTSVTFRLDHTPTGTPVYPYVYSAYVAPLGGAYSNATAVAGQMEVSIEVDDLDFVSAPAVVHHGQVVSVTLDYTANPGPAKHVQVSLLAPNQGYAWYGGVSQTVAAGTGQVTVQFTVEGHPPSGSDYIIDAFIAPNGSDWTGATAGEQQAIQVEADVISFQYYPTSIWTPHTWNVQIAYTVMETRMIQVNLLTPAPGYTYRAHGTVTVGPGSGVVTVPVSVPNTFPSGWHFWSAFAAPPGGNWDTRTADAASGQVWVTLDPVHIVTAPATVARGGTYSVTLSWDVMQASEVHIDLVRDVVYTWHGGTTFNVGAGQGSQTVQVTVDAATPTGSDFLWSAWVGPEGQGYANRTADDVKAPVTVTAP